MYYGRLHRIDPLVFSVIGLKLCDFELYDSIQITTVIFYSQFIEIYDHKVLEYFNKSRSGR